MFCSAIDDRTLVIGYGNRLRGDDGVGPAVAEALKMDGWAAIACHQLLPELAETISRYRRLVLVDACADAPPGEVRWREVESSNPPGGMPIHGFDPAALLAMAARLYGSAPRTSMATIGGEQWDRLDELSPQVRRAMDQVCHDIQQRFDRASAPTAEEVT